MVRMQMNTPAITAPTILSKPRGEPKNARPYPTTEGICRIVSDSGDGSEGLTKK
jgi:hypothetical protein